MRSASDTAFFLLSFLLAIYIGLFMNGAVFYRRFGSY
ncbi:hypothetical protein ACUOA8_26025, partial [Escherichia sp. SS-MK2]